MGQTAENVATYRGISRAEQDEFAARSQQVAEKAIADGFFDREITPVTLPGGTRVIADDGPRANTTVQKLAGLRTVFRESGTVTAGNACPLDIDRLNVNGGGIALGHPFGATGARITTTLLHSLQERDKQFSLETMCIGGGQGMAIIFERLS